LNYQEILDGSVVKESFTTPGDPMERFFSQCPDCGFETFKTAKEAEADAEAHLDHYRDDAPDGWNEEVTGICWGEVKGEVVQTYSRPYDAEVDVMIASDCDEVWDFGLMPIEPEESDDARLDTEDGKYACRP
jgi:predicted  nucleic acid-binding Zn-ribbon protein